jgi:O-antigen biosynthesis protein WbqP
MFLKRLLDLTLSVIAFIPAFALCVPAVIAIRIESPGAPLFRQKRVGKNQVPFTLIKLRTMASGTTHAGSHEVSAAQITKVGHFLRRTKIDELPQIWNVLIGQMSFVGPRPCLPNQDTLVKERSNLDVFTIRPGITGPAQVAGIDMSTPRKLAVVDAEYIQSRSFLGDLRLILQTASGSGRGDAVKKI